MTVPTLASPTSVDAQVRGIRVAGAVAAGLVLIGPALELGTLCPLRRATGVPCPLCGLTRGVAAAARGDVGGALAAHPLALVALAVLVTAWTPVGPAMVEGLRHRPAAIAAALVLVWGGRLLGLYGS